MYNFIAQRKEKKKRKEAQKKNKRTLSSFSFVGGGGDPSVSLSEFLKFKMQALKFLPDLHAKERKPLYTYRRVGFKKFATQKNYYFH